MTLQFRRAVPVVSALALGLATACAPRDDGPARAFDPDSIPEAFAHSSAALAEAGATRAFRVTPDGALENGAWRVAIEVRDAHGSLPPPSRIAAEARWKPVLHWTRARGAARCAFEAVVVPSDGRDSVLLVSLAFRAAADPASGPLEVSFAIESPGANAVHRAWDASDGERDRALSGWLAEGGRGTGVAMSARAGRPDGARWTIRGAGTGRVVLATYARPAAALRRALRRPHAHLVARALADADARLAAGAEFRLGDETTESGVAAARLVLLAARERRGAAWVPIGGPFHYRDVWLRDGARAIAALAVAEHVPEARALARGLLDYQWPNGAFLSQRGQLDGTGQALWAMDQALLRPAPDTGLASVADAADAAIRWAERQRRFAPAAGLRFAGLLPHADPRDNEKAKAQLVGNDAWMIAGEAAASRLARAAGRAALADSIARQRDDDVARFARALAASGSPDVPPSWQGEGRDWGNVSAATPCGAIAFDDPRAARLAERLWRSAGGPGLGTYGGPDSLHAYDFADLATWAMLAGRRAEAEAALDSMLAWRTASGGVPELFSRRSRDHGVNVPPHATAAAMLVWTVRNALVHDDAGDTLRLTLGARERWWRNGALKRAPTRFGTVDLGFASDGREARWDWTPVAVWTTLTLPPGAVLAAPPAAPLVAAGDARVLAPPGTRAARVRIAARGAAR